ncbi:MAG: hypothetical protein U5N26_07085 [Candidatus Marinimicrobia bacterium]|nr:hypothetical protein [Candidatus Neomarinimicrobiota bacterium]
MFFKEKDALIVLKAYADEDLETLKSYAGFAQTNVMDEDYFKTNSIVSSLRKKIPAWKGSFDEIRYYKNEINFQVLYYMVAVLVEKNDVWMTGRKYMNLETESEMLTLSPFYGNNIA